MAAETKKRLMDCELKRTDNQEEIEIEIEYDCLENCLSTLHTSQYRLVVEYYGEEGFAKVENRRQLAESFGISSNALRAKAFRIRSRLKECVRKCVAKKNLK